MSHVFVFFGKILKPADALCQIVFSGLYNLFGYDFFFLKLLPFFRHLKQNKGNGEDQLVALLMHPLTRFGPLFLKQKNYQSGCQWLKDAPN